MIVALETCFLCFPFRFPLALFVVTKEMNFWAPGASAPGVDREYEDEGIYVVNDTQSRLSIDQQVCPKQAVVTT